MKTGLISVTFYASSFLAAVVSRISRMLGQSDHSHLRHFIRFMKSDNYLGERNGMLQTFLEVQYLPPTKRPYPHCIAIEVILESNFPESYIICSTLSLGKQNQHL